MLSGGISRLGLFIIFGLSFLTTDCHAFFPWDWRAKLFGSQGTSHQTMTRNAFKRLVSEVFEVNTLSPSMQHALGTIIIHNALVDNDQKHAAKHCDGESFPEAQKILVTSLDMTAESLKQGQSTQAREILGAALHTLQDFYSHSTWVEGLSGAAPTTYPDLYSTTDKVERIGPDVSTCKRCDQSKVFSFPSCPDCTANVISPPDQPVLTSGYYPGNDRPLPAGEVYKCQHGGRSQSMTGNYMSIQGINKDSKSCSWSPHNYLHDLAAKLAEEASIEYIRVIQQRVEGPQFRALFGIGPSMGFAIDTSGGLSSSMKLVTDQITRAMEKKASSVFAIPRASLYVLTRFGDNSFLRDDTNTPYSYSTHSYDAFRADLSLRLPTDKINHKYWNQPRRKSPPTPGRFCQPNTMEGIRKAIIALDIGASLFIMVSTDSADSADLDQVCEEAKTKKVRLYIFLIDVECPGAHGADYRRLADSTEGAFFIVPKSAIPEISGHILHDAKQFIVTKAEIMADFKLSYFPTPKSVAKSKADNSMARRDVRSTAKQLRAITIDSSTTALTFSLHGPSASLNLTRPDGLPTQYSLDANTTFTPFHQGARITITSPPPGTWLAQLESSEPARLLVHATHHSLHLESLCLVAHSGRTAHEGYFPLQVPPLPGTRVHLQAVLNGLPAHAPAPRFELRDAHGARVQLLAMKRGHGSDTGHAPIDSFLGPVIIPKQRTWVHVVGRDGVGVPFQRVQLLPMGGTGTNLYGVDEEPGNEASTALTEHKTGDQIEEGEHEYEHEGLDDDLTENEQCEKTAYEEDQPEDSKNYHYHSKATLYEEEHFGAEHYHGYTEEEYLGEAAEEEEEGDFQGIAP